MTHSSAHSRAANRIRTDGDNGVEPMVWLRQVTRSFVGPRRRTIPVLRVDELRLERGAGLLVLGPNGSGKTTLLHLLAGLLRADGGQLRVAGTDLRVLSESERDRWRATALGYLLQGSALLEGLTAQENVMLPLLLCGVRPARQRQRAGALLAQLGVAHRARHRPADMSGGERQRVALARALANDPPLLLADEPTASLDAEGARQFVDCLAELRREEQRTLVIATHHPELFDSSYRRLELERLPTVATKGTAG